MFRYIIFDADHTLLEFDSDEKAALKDTFADFGYAGATDEELTLCRNDSYAGWAAAGLNDVHKIEIQKNYHELYLKYIYTFMGSLVEKYSLSGSPKEVGDRFISYFSRAGHVIGKSLDVVYRLSQYYDICIATNGLSSIQRGRLSPFDGVIYKYFISDETGHIKPEKAFFENLLSSLGATADECLMVGDSLSSDIAGAASVGMRSCFFNRYSLNAGNYSPDYTVSDIGELLSILL